MNDDLMNNYDQGSSSNASRFDVAIVDSSWSGLSVSFPGDACLKL